MALALKLEEDNPQVTLGNPPRVRLKLVGSVTQMGVRDYDPGLGRFTQVDPDPGGLADPISQNPYVYAQDNPVNMLDLDGRRPELVAGAIVAAGAAVRAAVPIAVRQISIHAAKRMAERGVTKKMVDAAIRKGTRYWDPKNGTINHILKNGFNNGDDLLIGRNPFTGRVTTVLKGPNLIRSRMVPLQ